MFAASYYYSGSPATSAISVLVTVAGIAGSIYVLVDASRRPDYQYQASGQSKGLWIGLGIGSIVLSCCCGILGIALGLVYHLAVRPKLEAAGSGGGMGFVPPAPGYGGQPYGQQPPGYGTPPPPAPPYGAPPAQPFGAPAPPPPPAPGWGAPETPPPPADPAAGWPPPPADPAPSWPPPVDPPASPPPPAAPEWPPPPPPADPS